MKPKVLIADDSTLVLRMLEKLLASAGVTVIAVRDGLAAIERAFAEDLDLVILDVSMPRMNGYQACRLLKTDASTRHVPVVILTGRDEAGDRFWGLETGADYYVTKDAEPQKILELVRNVLSGAERRPARPAPTGKGASLDVLSRVNDLLDRKLYEATILSEISRVARGAAELEETFTPVMALVGRIVDYTVGGMAFIEGESLEVLLAMQRRAAPALVDAATQRLLDALAQERKGAGFRRVQTRLATSTSGGSGPLETALGGFLAFPIRKGEQLAGLLALAGRAVERLSPENRAFLRHAANQAFVVTENSRLLQRLQHLAVHDGLTELFNHRHSHDLLIKECHRVGRYAAGGVSALMIDIDHFKNVNDRHGHLAGDVVLRDVARVLKEGLRSVDTIGRYGGEEFLVILPHTDPGEARLLAERLRGAVADHVFHASGADLRVTISLGVATYPSAEVQSPEDLIREADRLLYRAKEAGRNRVA